MSANATTRPDARPRRAGVRSMLFAALLCVGVQPSLALPQGSASEASEPADETAATRPADAHPGKFAKAKSLRIERDETVEGDRYWMVGTTFSLDGRMDGDLATFAGQSLHVDGVLDGDLFAYSNVIEIGGEVLDSARVVGNFIEIDGVIDGDVLATASVLTIAKDAEIRGDLTFGGGQLYVLGEVRGSVRAGCGEAEVRGSVGGDAVIRSDTVNFHEDARVGGDLRYTTREEAEIPEGVVAGESVFEPREKEVQQARPWTPMRVVRAAIWWLIKFAWGLVSGAILIRLFRKTSDRIVGAFDEDRMVVVGVGFVTMIVAPVALVLSSVMIVTIPAVLTGLVLYVVAAFLATLPFAAWVGRALLRRFGGATASPYAELFVGLVVLHLLLALPLPYLPFLMRLFMTLVGMGMIVLGIRARVEQLRSQPA